MRCQRRVERDRLRPVRPSHDGIALRLQDEPEVEPGGGKTGLERQHSLVQLLRARAIGGASLPFLAKFMRDRELLFREPEEGKIPGEAPLHAARLSAF